MAMKSLKYYKGFDREDLSGEEPVVEKVYYVNAKIIGESLCSVSFKQLHGTRRICHACYMKS